MIQICLLLLLLLSLAVVVLSLLLSLLLLMSFPNFRMLNVLAITMSMYHGCVGQSISPLSQQGSSLRQWRRLKLQLVLQLAGERLLYVYGTKVYEYNK